MSLLARRSLAFRLWFDLSLVATLFTAITLSAYVWLTIGDDVANARAQMEPTIEAVVSNFARLSGGGLPTGREVDIGHNLGIRYIEVLDADGRVTFRYSFDADAASGQELTPAMLAAAKSGTEAKTTIQFHASSFSRRPISSLDVIQGGSFGEEHLIPLSSILLPQDNAPAGSLHVVAGYSDLARQAHELLWRSLFAGAAIIIAVLLGMWLFLHRFLSRPMQRYSDLAIQIAAGEPVRMPAAGRDELSELGRALNGMADALEHQATVDTLTGLYNLRHLSSNLEALLAFAERQAKPLALVVGDLDNLKPINDTYGHPVGDRVLRAVGTTLRAWSGREYTCWRLGGDEFVVALPGLSEEGAQTLAVNLRKAIGAIVIAVGEEKIQPSISVGLACYPEDAISAGDLLAIADRRMYEAKSMRAEERKLAASSAA